MVVGNRLIYFLEHIVNPKYQIIAVFLTSCTVILLSMPALSRFVALEPSPQMFSITPKLIKDWGGNTTLVKVGLHIVNFPEFDIVKNKFVIDAIIWFEFDPAVVSLETIEKFSFEKGDILKKTTSDTKLIEGKFFVQYNITIQFTSNLSFKFFPMDSHRIFLVLTNKFVSPGDIIYQSFISGFTLSESIFLAGWNIEGRHVITGYSEARLDEHDVKKVVLNPRVLFAIDFDRSGIQKILLIFLPLFLMFFIGLLSLSFDVAKEAGSVLSLSLGSVTGILSYRFVIQAMSPEVGYFMLSDQIFTLFLSFAFSVFLLNIVLIWYKQIGPRLIALRGMTFIMVHITLVSCWYYLLYEWVTV